MFLKGKGLVRELHVYGETTAVNSYKMMRRNTEVLVGVY